jgi:hypothetical protein
MDACVNSELQAARPSNRGCKRRGVATDWLILKATDRRRNVKDALVFAGGGQ